jgi:hypothetical protein
MARSVGVWLLAGTLAGCALSSREQDTALVPVADGGMPPGSDAAMLAPDDDDHDGLCNETEKDLGTDPTLRDTDGDGYPDLVEVMAEHDARDPRSPGLDQVGFLAANRGSVIDFEARVTVDGEGEGYSGLFAAYPSPSSSGLTANDFMERGSALSAEPPDHVRGVNVEGERFDSVAGRTRLAFRLRFMFDRPAEDFPCADSFPFTYGVKDDLGRRVGIRDYTLVVLPEGSTGLRAEDFCVPEACF